MSVCVRVCMCVCGVCVCVCACACVRACVRACTVKEIGLESDIFTGGKHNLFKSIVHVSIDSVNMHIYKK